MPPPGFGSGNSDRGRSLSPVPIAVPVKGKSSAVPVGAGASAGANSKLLGMIFFVNVCTVALLLGVFYSFKVVLTQLNLYIFLDRIERGSERRTRVF